MSDTANNSKLSTAFALMISTRLPSTSSSDTSTGFFSSTSSSSSSSQLSSVVVPSVDIVPLLSHPPYISSLSSLLFSEWSNLYALENIFTSSRLAETLSSRPPSSLPLTFIALSSSLASSPSFSSSPSSTLSSTSSPSTPFSPSSPSPTLLGTVTLDVSDVPRSCPYYGVYPWLSSLLVVESARGKGIGKALVRGLEEEVERRDIKWLWLWTVKSKDMYEKWGWRVIEWWWFEEKGKHIAIMRKDYGNKKQAHHTVS